MKIRQDQQWDKNKLTQGALFAKDRTTFLSRVEEACRHDEDLTHLAVTDFCSWTLALTCAPEKFRPRSQLLTIHRLRDTT